MGMLDRIVGWIWDAASGRWKKPADDEVVWKDTSGERRSAVIVRGVGVGPDGVGYEYDAMCGLPDPNVRYPARPRDPYEVMAEEGPNSAAWYRGLYEHHEFF